MPPEFLAIFLDDDVPEPNAFLGIEEDVEDGGDGHEVPDPEDLARHPDVKAVLEAAAALPT
jgi:hypothetical protein